MNPRPLLLASITLISAFVSVSAFAQTNTFPASGNVGIGTANPLAKLDVDGAFYSRQAGMFFADSSLPTINGAPWYGVGVSNLTLNGHSSVLQLAGYYGLHLKTASGSLTLLSNGNVGIGTGNPQVLLDVQQSTSDTVIRSKSTIAGAWLVADSAHDQYFGLRLESVGTPRWFFGCYETADLTIKRGSAHAGAELMRVTTTGNVGIGTSSPEQKLHVTGGRLQVNTAAAWDNFQIYTDGWRSYLEANGDEDGLWIRSNTGQKVIIPTANVGIGTSNPTHKLAVNGTIKAREIIVETTGWSDYVFADDYRLAPLAEVEAHIKTNKHLPGLPSASEVAEQGVSLGDMQARLLAKIEELTLHQIAQEKRLAAQNARIAALEAENHQLKPRVR